MYRTLAVLILSALLVSVARADIPPPAGFKRVTLNHKIETDKEYPDYLFYTAAGEKVTLVKLTPKTPVVISGAAAGGRFKTTLLYAVPKDAGKNYKSQKEFHKAILDENVKGLLRAGIPFSGITEVKVNDTRKVVVEQWKLEKLDKKGEEIVINPVKKDKKPKNAPEEEEETDERESPTTAYTPRGGVWIAGLACFAAMTLGGLWLAGRGKRKV
ncbi:MAG: hypothetical protein L0241_05360 [Planctomycetia bacterium]|nr:hypothetical protein [Planctomycetia bacterium]